MKGNKIIGLLCAAIIMVGCGTSKRAVSPQTSDVSEPAVPAWHTCVIQGARATILLGEEQISSSATLQVVRDSMLVISITPIAGIEIIRIEATPAEVIGISKIDGTYAVASYDEINRKLVPAVTWETLQQLCSAELPTGSDQARLVYMLDDKRIELAISYPARRLDVPVRVNHIRTDRYKKVDISKWL